MSSIIKSRKSILNVFGKMKMYLIIQFMLTFKSIKYSDY